MQSNLTFDESLNDQCDKEHEAIGLDTTDLFEQQRSGVVDTFELAEAFSQSGLILVGQ